YAVKSVTAGVEAKLIQDRLAFLRFHLSGEPATIELVLEKM
ncbi:MAG: hypothetical protein K0Q63_2948, partial [Paenibacillus sp.]|nr:hypothetical protein [Paenibacillus sp.]